MGASASVNPQRPLRLAQRRKSKVLGPQSQQIRSESQPNCPKPWLFQSLKSVLFCSKPLFFNPGDVWQSWQFWQFCATPPPTPYVHPFPPKVTQCHPRLRGQAEGRNPKNNKTQRRLPLRLVLEFRG